ncbi:unnamed protein product [Jaminaea pallidilutea]
MNRPPPPKQTFSQQVVWALTRRGATAAPLSSSTTVSPAQHSVDHHNLRSPESHGPAPGGASSSSTPTNPFEHQASQSEPLSPVSIGAPLPDDETFSSHVVELLKPTPLTEPTRKTVIAERAARLRIIAKQTANRDDNTSPPPQGQVFRLVIALLGGTLGEQDEYLPLPIHEATLELLNEAVKLSDQQAGEAEMALIETRSGAPGSQSSKSLDSEQPLATIDRALLYRLVVSDHAFDSDDDVHEEQYADQLPSASDLSRTALPGLHAKLRALDTLSKGGREVDAFDNIVKLLGDWLGIVWAEVQALRQLAKLIRAAPSSMETSSSQPNESSSSAPSGTSLPPIDHNTYVEQLSGREWSLAAILHLITSIIMFSFAKVRQRHIESAMQKLARLFLKPLPETSVVREEGDQTRRQSYGAGLPGLPAPIARSRSREQKSRQASVEGYSYYGTEAATPDVATSNNTSPALTPRFGPRSDHGVSSVAPMSLNIVPPGRSRAPTISASHFEPEARDAPPRAEKSDAVFSELQDVEVRCVLKLLDAALKFGHVPSGAVTSVCMMMCRIIGYESLLMVAASPNGLHSLARTISIAPLTPWQEAALPLLANLLRSHSANSCIQVVRDLLVQPLGGADDEASQRSAQPLPDAEDEATVVGAVLFFRFALLIVSKETSVASGSGGNTALGSSSSVALGATIVQESALAPRLTLSLILPALRGALSRHWDLVDLQVISLAEALLVPSSRGEDSQGPSSSLAPGGSVAVEEWDELLQLTLVAKRHVESWYTAVVEAASDAKVPAVLQALSGLLSRLPLAPSDQVGPTAAAAASASASGASQGSSHVLPWTPRLCALLLAMGPLLPTHLVQALVDYHRAHHLCLPCNVEWIANIQRLLRAFNYGGESALHLTASSPAKTWWQTSRRAIASLLFDHIYEAVVSFPEHRSRLLRQIILPTAQATLITEKDPEVSIKMRKVLVQAAALSSVADDPEWVEESMFDAVRSLLLQYACEADHKDEEVSEQTSSGHVHFAPAAVSLDGITGTNHMHQPVNGSTSSASANSSAHAAQTKGTEFALDLIAIFTSIAFASPWIDFDDSSHLPRDVQERRAHDACLAIFRDLLGLVQPQTSAGDGSKPSTAGPSVRTKLAILQWFLHIRTDRHHRVYLAGNLDEVVSPAAATILRTAEARASAAAAAEASALAANDKARAGSTRNDAPRESRRTTAVSAADGTARSKSRARETSQERGRAQAKDSAVQQSPRRGGERSVSASRGIDAQSNRKQPRVQQALWQIPEALAFEMPPTSLRSDIVYTYIHEDDPTCSHAHRHHRGTGESGGSPAAALPVSALLACYIRLIENERDWELISYLICFLPHQLANKHLFCGPKAQQEVLVLRGHLCAAIDQQKLMQNVVLPEDIKRSDVYAVAYGTLTTLLSYRALFTRNQQEEMVDAFLAGLNKSQNTALPCVRALSVAVYEAQKSVTRLLPKILVKLSTIMSSMTMSVHILELIASIGQIPACYANFTEGDYRRVFGIALQYIQYHQSPAGSGREDFRSSPALFALSQYVMMLAYYCISLWFMSLRLSERPKHVSSIVRGLMLANEGHERMSDNSEVCIDFLSRFTHSNIDPKPSRSFMNSIVMSSATSRVGVKDSNRASKTWLVGKGLITISTLRKEGWVEIVVRRSSGTAAMLCKLENAPLKVLPDEDEAERADLPAALMMSRDARQLSKPVLRAPAVFAKAEPFDLKSLPKESAQDEPEGQVGHQEPRSAQSEAKETLETSERLRRRRPTGPASFGLAPRPRGASFSGAIEADTVPLPSKGISDPYRLADEGTETALGDRGGEDAIRGVMNEILQQGREIVDKADLGSKGIDAGGKDAEARANGSAEVSKFQPPPKQSVERDFAIDPSTIALQLSSFPDFLNTTPILLPDEPATTRLIRAIDLTPVVDLHKIGCVYVGPGQTSEPEILGNRHGSPAYARFLTGLGDLITLRGQEDVYTGGLDREQDLHGKYAYAWSDDISQIVFHAATMMPNRPDVDPNHSTKKALIGNDWVHIVFNEGGREYDFGTIPSQFNYVNIVISPNTKGGTALGSVGPVDTSFYRVSLQRRPGLPSFSPIGDGQLISAVNLAAFVRSLALNANVMSQIYNATGEQMTPYSSNWCNRLNHVVRFRGMFEAKRKQKDASEQGGGGGGPAGVHGGGGGGVAGQEQDPRDFTAFT